MAGLSRLVTENLKSMNDNDPKQKKLARCSFLRGPKIYNFFSRKNFQQIKYKDHC